VSSSTTDFESVPFIEHNLGKVRVYRAPNRLLVDPSGIEPARLLQWRFLLPGTSEERDQTKD
jgi:hypothetical protein